MSKQIWISEETYNELTELKKIHGLKKDATYDDVLNRLLTTDFKPYTIITNAFEDLRNRVVLAYETKDRDMIFGLLERFRIILIILHRHPEYNIDIEDKIHDLETRLFALNEKNLR